MLIIRELFVAKPGNASKLAKLFKKMMADMEGVRILTDSISDFNQVIIETEVENLTAYEKKMEEYSSGDFFDKMDSETKEAMKNYTEMYQTGRREVFKVV